MLHAHVLKFAHAAINDDVSTGAKATFNDEIAAEFDIWKLAIP